MESPTLTTYFLSIILPYSASFCPRGTLNPPRISCSGGCRSAKSLSGRRQQNKNRIIPSRHFSSQVDDCSNASDGSDSRLTKTIDTVILDGPFSVELFASSNCWGRRPVLIRSAFDAEKLLSSDQEDEDEDEASWPSWNDVALLSCDEEGESRLITHRPGEPESWALELGPFEDEDVTNILNDDKSTTDASTGKSEDKWTLVVNDVDRFFPSLADWMDQEYSFIPRWRRDDAQISLADKGGGIGPHVDNYDVFLIQMAGTRTWEVGKKSISVEEEYDSLLEGLDVRILSNWEDDRKSGFVETYELNPGDYLPPRIPHCGVALTDGSMTLSVGCRAPSANDMVSRIAEIMANSVTGFAVERVTDIDLLNIFSDGYIGNDSGQISALAKDRARQLVKNAIEEYLDNDDAWDKIFGRLVTESKRPRINYPVPLAEGDEEDLGVWGDPKLAVAAMLEGNGALYQAEGISFGYSLCDGTEEKRKCHRLFVDGDFWDVTPKSQVVTATYLRIISSQRRLDREVMESSLHSEEMEDSTAAPTSVQVPREIVVLLEELVGRGYLYGTDE